MRPEPVQQAIDAAGSIKALAKLLGLAPQGVGRWQQVPVRHAKAVARLTGLPLHRIRPDIYEPPEETEDGEARQAKEGNAGQ